VRGGPYKRVLVYYSGLSSISVSEDRGVASGLLVYSRERWEPNSKRRPRSHLMGGGELHHK